MRGIGTQVWLECRPRLQHDPDRSRIMNEAHLPDGYTPGAPPICGLSSTGPGATTPIVVNLVLLALSGFVAYGRFVLVPF
jgi:hypothetical protein